MRLKRTGPLLLRPGAHRPAHRRLLLRTKLSWILDHGGRAGGGRRALFGTVDSWLVWKLTGGRSCRLHQRQPHDALDIQSLCWDPISAAAWASPCPCCPRCGPSGIYGSVELQGAQIPIAGIAGDQQAALFGQACFSPGEAKNTYGTGCFLLMNTGERLYRSNNGLLSTIAISLDGKVQYALEGSVFVGGAVIQWVRDGRFIGEARDAGITPPRCRTPAASICPRLHRLGAPTGYARPGRSGGLTRGTGQDHIVRAAQSPSPIRAGIGHAMEKDTDPAPS
ncbi:MAG: FGGY family carbohydrate kinase [Flavonifractor plautii]